MSVPGLAAALTAVNFGLLSVGLTRVAMEKSPLPPEPVIRARVLELVDQRGQVRSRLNVEASGEVVFRMLDQRGTIRVKLGAGTDGSGLVLLDEDTEPGVHLVARRAALPDRATTSLTLKSGERSRIIRP
jgi:hypothetical protein